MYRFQRAGTKPGAKTQKPAVGIMLQSSSSTREEF
jgi:hypothetical protein